jgi:hypothetical protein
MIEYPYRDEHKMLRRMLWAPLKVELQLQE